MDPLVLVAGVAVAIFAHMQAFRKTSHGANPWTVEGFFSALSISGHIERAAALTGGTWASCYRHPAIQKALYDSKRGNPAKWAVVESSAKKAGMTTEAYVAKLSTGSRHSRGLAADFGHAKKSIGQLASELHDHAKAGRIGPVKKVLDERDHAHVEWFGSGETVKPPILERV